MIFQHTWQKVVRLEKTATRRLWVDGDYTWMCGVLNHDFPPISIYSEIVRESGKPRYRRGQRVPVMPSRGVRGQRKVADFEIAMLWRQDVRNISETDATKEGFHGDIDAFLEVWCAMHDPDILPQYTAMYRRGWLDDRPRERYLSSVIEWLPESVVVYQDNIRAAILAAAASGVPV